MAGGGGVGGIRRFEERERDGGWVGLEEVQEARLELVWDGIGES